MNTNDNCIYPAMSKAVSARLCQSGVAVAPTSEIQIAVEGVWNHELHGPTIARAFVLAWRMAGKRVAMGVTAGKRSGRKSAFFEYEKELHQGVGRDFPMNSARTGIVPKK